MKITRGVSLWLIFILFSFENLQQNFIQNIYFEEILLYISPELTLPRKINKNGYGIYLPPKISIYLIDICVSRSSSYFVCSLMTS